MSPDFVPPRPTHEIDRSLWASSVAQLDADQKQAIRQSLFDLLVESVDETLLRMGLTGKAVAYAQGVRAEGCWPLPDRAGQAAAMGAMYGPLGVALFSAGNQGIAIARLPVQVDEKGLVC